MRTTAALLLCLVLTGCIGNRPSKRPATDQDAALATPAYWWARPADNVVQNPHFEPLLQACQKSMASRFFDVDVIDRRQGLLLSRPSVSAQPFEPWRRDIGDQQGAAQSALATVRRTVRWDFVRLDNGLFEARPRVLVERYASAERRITDPSQFLSSFNGPSAGGTVESDQGRALPSRYWYATGRDLALEAQLAQQVRDLLASSRQAAMDNR